MMVTKTVMIHRHRHDTHDTVGRTCVVNKGYPLMKQCFLSHVGDELDIECTPTLPPSGADCFWTMS
jgi:ribosomal protein S17